MFIIEKLIDDHRRRVEAWKRARYNWVSKGSDYDYRTDRGYERDHPRPGTTLKTVLRGALVVHIVIAVIGIIIGLAITSEKNSNQHPKKPEKQVVYQNGVTCDKFKIGDIAQIQYGDYQGAEVKLVGGCADSEDYQVEVTKDQTLFADGSKNPQFNDVYIKKGLTFKVDDNNNLVVTGHNKGENNVPKN